MLRASSKTKKEEKVNFHFPNKKVMSLVHKNRRREERTIIFGK
jgi:hypothetical protein